MGSGLGQIRVQRLTPKFPVLCLLDHTLQETTLFMKTEVKNFKQKPERGERPASLPECINWNNFLG